MTALRPCPACGGNAMVSESCGEAWVRCAGNCIAGRLCNTRAHAIETWNALPRRGDEAASWTTTTTTQEPAIDARTLLAGMAMQGLLAGGQSHLNPPTVATRARRHADVLLAELAKEVP